MKKKHLSRIVIERILMTLAGVFLLLMAVTVISVCQDARIRTDELLKNGLQGLKSDVTYKNENNHLSAAEQAAGYTDSSITEKGTEFLYSREYFSDMMSFVDLLPVSELNIIDQNGIITVSSTPENVGFDMHSDPEAAEFLCLLDGKTESFFRDFAISPMNGTRMKYVGVPIPAYGGFALEGQSEEEYASELEGLHSTQIRYDEIGTTGYYLLINKEGRIVSSPKDIYTGETFILSDGIKEAAESGRVIKKDIFGGISYVSVAESAGDYILAVYPFSEAWETWNAAIAMLVLIYVLVFLILFFLINRLMKRHVVAGVYSLNGSLGRITEGDLEEKADYRDSVEFDELSDGINYTVDWLKKLIKEAEERIDRELALAAKIQTSFLPHDVPDRNEFELYSRMEPAKEVGGDFYDYFLIDHDHLALVMADVSGKGIPAALFMVMAKDKLKNSVLKHGTDVAEAVREANVELCRENDAGLFVTVWLGVLTLSTGHMEYVDAGHEYPAISRNGGEFAAEEDVHSAPVAARKKTKFEAGSFEMDPGDILFLYTDGVTEANDTNGEMFRRSRMLEALNKDRSASAKSIDDRVRSAIRDFVKDAPQFDDTTTLVFRYKKILSHFGF